MEGPDPKAFQDFESIFGDFFGTRRTRTRDLTVPLSITLVEAANGSARSVELPRVLRCDACEGKGGAPGAKFEPCATCEGRGGEQVTRGTLTTSTRCKDCVGTGGRWSRVCELCDGRGEAVEKKRTTVQVPPGIEEGSILRLAGQGNDLGEGAGDALLLVEVMSHPTLRRVGVDLHTSVHVDADLKKHGGTVNVPWLAGEAIVRVPAGVVEGTEIRLRGWGCVRLGSPYAPPPTDDESPYRASASAPRGDLVATVTFATGPSSEARPAGPKRGSAWGDRAVAIVGAVIVIAVALAMAWER